MESLSRFCLSASPPFLNPLKSTPSPRPPLFHSLPTPTLETQTPFRTCPQIATPNLSSLSLPFLALAFPLSSFASEALQEAPGRINLESILISIDDFFNRYPFFVSTVVFVWLVAIPLTETYLQKYKFISALNAFKKLQTDPTAQLLDIRDDKSVTYLPSPNLKLLSKNAVQIRFRQGDEEGFVKRVLQNFGEPANTTLCILDNFDGNSMEVAELLVKNGFREAYAIRGGIRGKKGWQEIQETLLPLSVHIYPKKRTKKSKQLDSNGGLTRKDENKDLSSNTDAPAAKASKEIKNENFSSLSPTIKSKGVQKAQSPYPNYPDLKPPSSPTPSKPE